MLMCFLRNPQIQIPLLSRSRWPPSNLKWPPPGRRSGLRMRLHWSQNRHNKANQHLSAHTSQTRVAAFNPTCVPRLLAIQKASCFQSAYCTWRERYTMYGSDDDWDEFLLTDINLCLKYVKICRRWMQKLWEPRSDGEYFELCNVAIEFHAKFKEYSTVNIRTFNYILDRVNPMTPNEDYSGRTAPLTSNVAFYIFIQKI